MLKSKNDQPFEHHSHNGAKFFAKRCDLRGGITARVPSTMSKARLMADVAEMIGTHAATIIPDLNGFAGYGGITFTIEEA